MCVILHGLVLVNLFGMRSKAFFWEKSNLSKKTFEAFLDNCKYKDLLEPLRNPMRKCITTKNPTIPH